MIDPEVQAWADEVSVWLHTLAFGDLREGERTLPPVLGGSTVLRERKHPPGCFCPICRGFV